VRVCAKNIYAISHSDLGAVSARSRQRESRSHEIMAQRPVMAARHSEHNRGRGGRHRVSRVGRPVHGHITGNLAIVAAHYTTGGFSQVGPILAVPVFIAVLGVVVLVFGGIESKSKSRRALLAGCLGLGLEFSPLPNADSPMAVLLGMLAVAAMATQNAMVKLALVRAPPPPP
jgi:hypothetical protein